MILMVKKLADEVRDVKCEVRDMKDQFEKFKLASSSSSSLSEKSNTPDSQRRHSPATMDQPHSPHKQFIRLDQGVRPRASSASDLYRKKQPPRLSGLAKSVSESEKVCVFIFLHCRLHYYLLFSGQS